MSTAHDRPLTLWRLTDGKPGHEKQTLGLANALARLTACRCIDIPAPTPLASLAGWLSGRFPAGHGQPTPDLILAAGHGTHLSALAARRAHGGRVVVAMRPSLPLAWFDLCLIPAHDNPPNRPNIVITQGVLNAVAPSQARAAGRGLILVGGKSDHYIWDSAGIIRQITAILHDRPDMAWRLTTSRRTPADFLSELRHADFADLAIFPAQATPLGWLETALAESEQVWVSPDSVSMVYESITSGAATGLFDLPPAKAGRIASGIKQLVDEHWLTTYSEWHRSRRLVPLPRPLDEAGRCAALILARWPLRRD